MKFGISLLEESLLDRKEQAIMYQRGRCCLGGWKTLPPRVELTYHNHDHQTFHLDDLGYSATDCSDRNNICDNSLREKARTKLRNFSAVEKTPSRAEPQAFAFLGGECAVHPSRRSYTRLVYPNPPQKQGMLLEVLCGLCCLIFPTQRAESWFQCILFRSIVSSSFRLS
jgi:hypothetical protein